MKAKEFIENAVSCKVDDLIELIKTQLKFLIPLMDAPYEIENVPKTLQDRPAFLGAIKKFNDDGWSIKIVDQDESKIKLLFTVGE